MQSSFQHHVNKTEKLKVKPLQWRVTLLLPASDLLPTRDSAWLEKRMMLQMPFPFDFGLGLGFFFASALGFAFAAGLDEEELLGKEGLFPFPFPLAEDVPAECFRGLLHSETACLVEPRLRQQPTVVRCKNVHWPSLLQPFSVMKLRQIGLVEVLAEPVEVKKRPQHLLSFCFRLSSSSSSSYARLASSTSRRSMVVKRQTSLQSLDANLLIDLAHLHSENIL